MANVMIVEDDKGIRSILCDLLSRESYETIEFDKGADALEFLEKNHVDLILLDLMLPGMHGEEVLQRIRKENTVPIIALTAKSELDCKVKLLREGADDYITKPFEPEEVLARVSAALRRYLSRSDEKIAYDDIVIDGVAKTVRVSSTLVDLTHKEYLILELLCRYPAKVFSKENLYESVWKDAYTYSDDALSVHVSNLRRKLKRVSGKDYIDTVWGIGYKIK